MKVAGGAASKGAASKGVGRRLLYALVKIAYGDRRGTHDTVPARRGDIVEDKSGKSTNTKRAVAVE